VGDGSGEGEGEGDSVGDDEGEGEIVGDGDNEGERVMVSSGRSGVSKELIFSGLLQAARRTREAKMRVCFIFMNFDPKLKSITNYLGAGW
jgi:hypothetical protein